MFYKCIRWQNVGTIITHSMHKILCTSFAVTISYPAKPHIQDLALSCRVRLGFCKAAPLLQLTLNAITIIIIINNNTDNSHHHHPSNMI